MQINPVMSALHTEPPAQKAVDASVQGIKKALEAQKLEGQAAVNLIEQAATPVPAPAEAGKPVVRDGKVDLYA